MAVMINPRGAALAPGLYPAATAWLSSGVAMFVSLLFHTATLIIFALVTLGSAAPSPVANNESLAATEVAIGTLAEERLSVRPDERFDDTQQLGGDAGVELLDTTVEIFADVRGPVASEFVVDELLSPLAASGGAQQAAIGNIDSTPILGGGSRVDGQATFMGIQAQGERFCIVADRSGSMFGPKFEFLKAQILQTVAGMSPNARLQIVFFSERSLPYPKGEWLHPGKERLAIETWLRGVAADGDTYPRPALNHAFALDPPPDTIFFMTDGQFDPQTVYQLRRLQRVAQRRVKIHTITFVDRSSEDMMRLIAAENGGTYRHIAKIGDIAEKEDF